MREQEIDLAIIGGGPAGLAAALAAAKSGIADIYLFDRHPELGGILPQCIHNGFGLRYFKEEMTGPEYAARFIEQLAGFPEVRGKTETMVTRLTADRRITTINPGEGLSAYQAKAVILAMGCRERPRGAINTPGSRPAGIFTAGTVQRLMNIEGYRPGRQAIIVGSGDIGLIMARRLTLEGINVEAVLELMPYSSGLTRNLVQCLEDFGIPLRLNHTVTRIFGDKRVEGVIAAPVNEKRIPIVEEAYRIDCDTLVLSIGLVPENELSVMAGIRLDPATGGPITDSCCRTTVPGIFACGNVLHVHDLVDDVSVEAETAGRTAAMYLRGEDHDGSPVRIIPGRNIRSVVPQMIHPDRETMLYIRAGTPERNVTLVVGKEKTKERVVNPGETIRRLIKPGTISTTTREIMVSLESDGDAHV